MLSSSRADVRQQGRLCPRVSMLVWWCRSCDQVSVRCRCCGCRDGESERLFRGTPADSHLPPTASLRRLAHKKVSNTFAVTLCKGILCNWLVCLAVWQVRRRPAALPPPAGAQPAMCHCR